LAIEAQDVEDRADVGGDSRARWRHGSKAVASAS
jgi:hypothetical protein